jgi:hypothetical protein
MGINKNSLRFLLLAKKKGVDFSRTAMIGRQTLNLPEEHFLDVMQNESDLKLEKDLLIHVYRNRYAEKLLELLGAVQIHSFDYSDYEKATYTHDFNQLIPEEHKAKYTLVIDGGSLEHIFNFPVAVQNCMAMIQEQGHFISLTPANNYFGHGFYQFSPELFYRIFNSSNGFNLLEMYYCDDKFSKIWHSVTDPDKVHKRVTLMNQKPTMLHFLAKREKLKKLFETTPQQSDYQIAWEQNSTKDAKSNSPGRIVKNLIPIRLRIYFKQKFQSVPDKECFTRFNIVDFLRSVYGS